MSVKVVADWVRRRRGDVAANICYLAKTYIFIIIFTAHAYFKPELLMVPYAFRIMQQYYIEFHKNAFVTLYRILSALLVLFEVSSLYVKKCLREISEKINLCE